MRSHVSSLARRENLIVCGRASLSEVRDKALNCAADCSTII